MEPRKGEERVAVLIPCYNNAPFLRAAIESVLAQTHPVHEIVVVDDGSTDDSAAIASSYPQVRVIRQANQGVAAARNRALQEARAEFLVFHDADDRLLPAAIEIGLRALADRPECGFVYGFSRPIRADGSPLPSRMPEPVTGACYATLLAGSALVPPSSALFRRSAVESAVGFRLATCPTDDYDFYLRIAQTFAIYCHNEVVVEYRRHTSNLSNKSAAQMRSVLATLEAQRPFVAGNRELEAALRRGRHHWSRIFGPGTAFEVLHWLKKADLREAARTLALVLRHDPRSLAVVARFRLELLLGRNPSGSGSGR